MPAKRVFLRVLDAAALKRLCGKRPAAVAGWVHREFGAARLGDRRLERRLLEIAAAFAAQPTAAIPQACGSWPATKAAYRFFDHERTTMDCLLEPHRGATVERMRREPVVLVVQDTTSLNYTGRPDMQGIGLIGSWANGPKGLLLHNTMAFRPDGLALGLLDVQCWRRDPAEFGVKKQRQAKAIADKESAKWLRPLAAVEQAARHCPDSRLVTVCDREADIYELFELAHRQGHELLVRAMQDRGLHHDGDDDDDSGRLRAHMASLAPAAEVELAVPRHAGQPARTARMAVRFANLTLAAPSKKKNLPPLPMTVVWSSEIDPPAGIKPLQLDAALQPPRRDPRAGPRTPALVCLPMEHRGLPSHPQERLQDRATTARNRRPPRSLPCHRHGRRLAHPASHLVRTRCPRHALHRRLRRRSMEGHRRLQDQQATPATASHPQADDLRGILLLDRADLALQRLGRGDHQRHVVAGQHQLHALADVELEQLVGIGAAHAGPLAVLLAGGHDLVDGSPGS